MSAPVLLVEDDDALREALCTTLRRAGITTAAAGDAEEALRVLARGSVELLVSDVQMPGMDGLALLREVRARHQQLPVLLMTAYGGVPQAVEAMREGAADYLLKPFEAEVLVGKVSSYLGADAREAGGEEAVAADPKSRELLALATRVARRDVSVMLTGESGVGKEVVARHIHRRSARAERPFVAINCAAIPENMLEAMLFGYEKGAYTGAYKACPGKFEQAQGGTLLLDEVSEMAAGLQAKLLRVLQEREVERLGGQAVIELDVRLIATSNRDLRAHVARGAFREDLYYRLNVFPLHIAPLRERPGDLPELAAHLLARAAKRLDVAAPAIGAEALARLRAHHWPGNVRELDNVLQRALVLANGTRLEACDLHFESAAPAPPAAQPEPPGVLDDVLRGREQDIIVEALRAHRGNRKKVAEKLGVSPRTLRYKLARLRAEGVALP